MVRRAFRRDVTPADVRPFLATYTAARQKRGFEASIAAALRDVLLAPDFLFRLEFDPRGAAPGSAHPVSGFELASRLSFFLWSSIPDDALLDVASSGELREPAGLDREVRRMLADPRAAALTGNFAAQWLGLRGLAEFQPDGRRSILSSIPALAAAFQQETRLFIRSVIRENRGILDLLGADYTYLNERLARQLRDFWRNRSRLSSCLAGWRYGERRAARPGQHPDGDVSRHQDIAGPARQVGPRQSAEFTATAASSERTGAR